MRDQNDGSRVRQKGFIYAAYTARIRVVDASVHDLGALPAHDVSVGVFRMTTYPYCIPMHKEIVVQFSV